MKMLGKYSNVIMSKPAALPFKESACKGCGKVAHFSDLFFKSKSIKFMSDLKIRTYIFYFVKSGTQKNIK